MGLTELGDSGFFSCKTSPVATTTSLSLSSGIASPYFTPWMEHLRKVMMFCVSVPVCEGVNRGGKREREGGGERGAKDGGRREGQGEGRGREEELLVAMCYTLCINC